MDGLTISVNNEYQSRNIRSETLFVGQVSTPALANVETDSFGYRISAKFFVTQSLASFGFRESYAPTLAHAFFNWIGEILPISLRSPLARMGTEELEPMLKAGAALNKKQKEEL